MTLFSPFKKESSERLTTMNALALVVFALFFLTSTLAHADHLTTHAVNAEQQECYICHQGLDTPSELPHVDSLFVERYNNNLFAVITAQSQVNYFVQPQLRAPPTFQ